MHWSRRILIGLVLVAASTLPLATPSVSASLPHTSSSTAPLAGVSVYFDDAFSMSAAKTMSQARLVFAYVKTLGANAVSLDIPFYEVGATSTNGAQAASAVKSGEGTPSPLLLESVIRLAEKDGLVVQLRPLLSELGDNIKQGVFRGTIAPANPAEWFQSYSNWLKPYLYVAQVTGVSSFSVGAELTTLVEGWGADLKVSGAVDLGNHDFMPYWLSLMQVARSIYKGNLIYSGSHLQLASVPGAGFGFDAYSKVTLSGSQPTSKTPASTVVKDFQSKIESNYKVQQTVPFTQEYVEELGIPAVAGAWTQPWYYSYPKSTPIARWVQEDWFTASCNAFNSLKMSGLFLWSLDLTTFDPTYNADRAKNYNSFQGTASETAIKSCFAAIKARG